MEKSKTMSNEEIIDELLHEAEDLKIREDVLTLAKVLQDSNPRMDKVEAIEHALNHLKNHR